MSVSSYRPVSDPEASFFIAAKWPQRLWKMMRLTVVCVLTLAVTAGAARAQIEDKLVEAGISVGAELLKTIGSKLASEGLDYLWGKDIAPDQRVAELQGRLTAYEDGFRRVDAKSADQIASLRKDLSSRTTADDVRRIVNETISALEARTSKLESRTGKLEKRQDAIDARIRDLEQFFAYIPTVPPAPLLPSASEESGKPAAHPLMVEWLNLLLRSEEGRHQRDGNGDAISFVHLRPRGSISPASSRLASPGSFEIGSVGGQEQCVVDQRRRRDFQIP